MTQPIQEPSTQRSVSGLAWGESQLARRPGPASIAQDTDLPWAYRYSNTIQTVPTATMTPVEFQVGDVSDTADIEIFDDSGDFGFMPHLSGFWRLRLIVHWDADVAYTGYVLINNSSSEVVDAISGRQVLGDSPKNFTMVWPQPARFGSDQPAFAYFTQFSGVDRDIFSAQFTAIYLGSYLGNPVGVT